MAILFSVDRYMMMAGLAALAFVVFFALLLNPPNLWVRLIGRKKRK